MSSVTSISGKAATMRNEFYYFTFCLNDFVQFPTQRSGIKAKMGSLCVGKLVNRISASGCPDGLSSSNKILEKSAVEKGASKSA